MRVFAWFQYVFGALKNQQHKQLPPQKTAQPHGTQPWGWATQNKCYLVNINWLQTIFLS